MIIYAKFGILYFLNRVLYRLVGIFKWEILMNSLYPARRFKKIVIFPPQPIRGSGVQSLNYLSHRSEQLS